MAVTMAKELVGAAFETPLAQGIALERRMFQSLFGLEDQKEGMAAFLEKRKPVFKGR
jgi:enoyl-CoA hydratase/carnithine racemase